MRFVDVSGFRGGSMAEKNVFGRAVDSAGGWDSQYLVEKGSMGTVIPSGKKRQYLLIENTREE
jgi:hypothetical protein